VTGNPFYPFLYSIFGGTGWEPEQARFYDLFVQNLGMGRTFLDYILLPWNLSFHAKMDSPHFDGMIGTIFIATLPFAAGIRKPEMALKIMVIFCLFTFLFWTSSAQQIRYLIPVFPFLAILIGSILTSFERKKFLRYLMMFLIAGGLAFNGYYIYRDYLNIKPLDVVVGKEERRAFLSRMLPSYAMFDYMNDHLPQNSKIFLIYMKNWTFLCKHECYSDSMFESYTIQKMLSQSSTPEDVSSALKERGFTHIFCDMNYIYGSLSTFTPHEKALFHTFVNGYLELERSDRSYYLYRIKQPGAGHADR
jgi:hypothetical protein